ncbi:MAG: T9SS type A sorting domain-containing protein [Bacteroidales bacterium]|nr:T9SS type A sorting domain-containing protein [Bacteroidales bacterium]
MNLKSISSLLAMSLLTATLYAQSIEYKFQEPKHYIGVTNTGSNMTVGIPETSWEKAPEYGDEIGAFNSIGQLVGSGVYLGGHFAITIWGDDETTMEKEGVAEETAFTLRLWSTETGKEETIIVERWLEGNDIYATNAISVTSKVKVNSLQNLPTEYQLLQNSPNPASLTTQISYVLPADVRANLSIWSIDGKLIKEVVNAEQSAGTYTVEVSVSELPSGNYYYKLRSPEFSAVRPMSVIR